MIILVNMVFYESTFYREKVISDLSSQIKLKI